MPTSVAEQRWATTLSRIAHHLLVQVGGDTGEQFGPEHPQPVEDPVGTVIEGSEPVEVLHAPHPEPADLEQRRVLGRTGEEPGDVDAAWVDPSCRCSVADGRADDGDVALPAELGNEPSSGPQRRSDPGDHRRGIEHPVQCRVGEDRIDRIGNNEVVTVGLFESDPGVLGARLADHRGIGIDPAHLDAEVSECCRELTRAAPQVQYTLPRHRSQQAQKAAAIATHVAERAVVPVSVPALLSHLASVS